MLDSETKILAQQNHQSSDGLLGQTIHACKRAKWKVFLVHVHDDLTINLFLKQNLCLEKTTRIRAVYLKSY